MHDLEVREALKELICETKTRALQHFYTPRLSIRYSVYIYLISSMGILRTETHKGNKNVLLS